jgi:hypothetical protein
MFNFGISNESAVRTSKSQLKPWNIHDVTFIGCEIVEGTSKNDPSKSWKRLDLKFENEDGYFNVPLWYPKEGDDVRRTYPGNNGGTVAYASNFEILMATVKQAAQILNPAGFEKMQPASSKFKDFDDVTEFLQSILNKVKGTETKLKLVGSVYNNKVTTKIPDILKVNNSGEYASMDVNSRPTYVADNFIGSKLFFSDYEEKKRQEFLNTTPTVMKSEIISIADTIPVEEESELDLNGLI